MNIFKSEFVEMFGENPVESGKWKVERLGNLCTITSGGTPDRKNEEYWKNGTIPWVKTTELQNNELSIVEEYITEKGLDESGAINIVASVILDYRAFDTLGESHVLFTASIVVLVLLLSLKPIKELKSERNITEKDLILQNTAKVVVPLIVMFGFYVMLAGHLGPGGGFSGGSIIGGALILYSYAFGQENLNKIINAKSYKYIVLCALAFYSISKCYSFFCGANHLESIFTPGTPGKILSAGLILPLNVAVGIVVACTMYGFYCYFTRGRI